LKTGIADGVIDRGLVVYPGMQAFAAGDKILAVPATHALRLDYQL
jgi:hypothetical protein